MPNKDFEEMLIKCNTDLNYIDKIEQELKEPEVFKILESLRSIIETMKIDIVEIQNWRIDYDKMSNM